MNEDTPKVNEWSDIHDPSGAVEIRAPFGVVRSDYDPEQIQELINIHGIRGMVGIINDAMRTRLGYSPLTLTNREGVAVLVETQSKGIL